MGNPLRSLCAFALMLILLFASRPSFACGPFTLDAMFTFTAHPEYPLEKFAAGQVGILQPDYARSYLFVAYREFSGRTFDAQEQKALVELWKDRLEYTWPDYDEEWPKPWVEARQKISGLATAPKISVSRHREKPNEYETYINCQKDAFDQAATALNERVTKFGSESAVVRDWVGAQDQVFANCSEPQQIPAPASAAADAIIRADRDYQIAAANFYAGNFDEARNLFEKISQDRSLWRPIAAYLVGRSLLRKGSLGPAEKKNEALAQAEQQLEKVLRDRSLTTVHPQAERLLNLVRLRLHPEEKVHDLAQALMKKDDQTLKQDLWDYTALLDQFIGDDTTDQHKTLPADLRKDDLTDWIVTVQTTGPDAVDHAVQRWQETSTVPWLVAALSKVKSDHPQATALTAAALKVESASAAFPSTSFHRLRLILEAGKLDQARTEIDELLARHKSRLPTSSLNLFLSLRMSLASNLNELLTFAQRVPAGFSFNEDGRELPADLSEGSDLKDVNNKSFFDLDGSRTLNEMLPLSVLRQAAESKVLPEHLRRDVAQAAWLRAVLLGDSNVARQLAPTLKTLVPELKPLLDDYLSATAEDSSKFSAIFAWLKFPGLQPVVTGGVGRRTALSEQDSFRDNWWCSAAFTPGPKEEGQDETEKNRLSLAVNAKSKIKPPAFLNAAQKAAARSESAKIAVFGAAPNYLCREVIAWAERNPTDPRVPEALHLAVRSTRYGCTDKETGRWSKAAFDTLHKRYPGNPWTKKTPYWFKD